MMQLKRCPFCGEEPMETRSLVMGETAASIQCCNHECLAQMDAYGLDTTEASREALRESWNRRASAWIIYS